MYDLAPLSNLMFVRDAGAIVHGGIVLSNMAHGVRARESLLFEPGARVASPGG
jgi:arginine deiminase